MKADDEILLTTILRRILVANDDTAILVDARGLQRKVKGFELDPHSVALTADRGRHDMLKRWMAERDQARSVVRLWEDTAKDFLEALAKSRGGNPPEGYTWRWSIERTDNQDEVAERWTKRLLWEVNQIIRRNADLHAEKAKLEDRVAYLEAALAHVTEKEAA